MSVSAFETIKRQAIGIAWHEAKRRKDEAQRRENEPGSSGITEFNWFAAMRLVNDPAKKPDRAWAELAAPHITFDEWGQIVDAVEAAVDFPGTAGRYLELLFDSLRMRDGGRVYV